jgi:haloacetate dehalogenase
MRIKTTPAWVLVLAVGAAAVYLGGFSARGLIFVLTADLVGLMAALGFDRFSVVGHDRGARVAYRMALDHRERVDRLAVLNVIPTVDQFERMAGGASLGYWPWFLLAQPAPFPEQLIAAAPDQFLRFVFDSWTASAGAIDEDAFAVYLEAFSRAAAAICGDYRASFWLDREHDHADRQTGRRIECPMLVITGSEETHLVDAADPAGDRRKHSVRSSLSSRARLRELWPRQPRGREVL